jgi:beta,beta-carotene 9',10'-dioxygenase
MQTTAVRRDSDERFGVALRTMRDEIDHDDLPISGKLPSWLTGTLLRLSVADFQGGTRRVNHLFDGLAMVHKFSFADGRVNYANRLLDTAARRARDRGKISFSEFGTEPCRSRFRRFTQLFRPRFTDNGNVNITRLGQEFLALTEVPLPVAFDPQTLKTLGVSDALPPGRGKPAHTTAHPHLAPASKALASYFTRFGARSHYELHETVASQNGAQDRLAGRMAVSRPSYMHSFGITSRYSILQENPLRVNPLELALSGRPFIENYRWNPGEGSLFHVFDRASGKRVGSWQADAFFCFHHVNAFERGDEVVVDLVAHEDAGPIHALYLDVLESGRAGDIKLKPTSARRFRLQPGGRLSEEELSEAIDFHFELPRINYRRCNGSRYRYVYGTGFLPQGFDAPDPELSKLDVETGELRRWAEVDCLPGEPVFVSSPQASGEDDGVVLSAVMNTVEDRSFLLVLDAQTFEERARARVPHRVPLSFHGNYFNLN